MALIRHGRIVTDEFADFSQPDNDTPLPAHGAVLVSLQQWQTHRDRLYRHHGMVGVSLAADEHPDSIARDLYRLSLVALRFPGFRDGRPYSSARLLRERYGYTGELRAVGDVQRDQLYFMQRCGFDSFEIHSADPLGDYLAAISEFSVCYQRASDEREPAFILRARSPAPVPESASAATAAGSGSRPAQTPSRGRSAAQNRRSA